MPDYPIDVSDRHLIADVNGVLALIDTGSPVSIGDQDLDFGGHRAAIPPAGWVGDIDTLVQLAGIQFDVLVGSDVLQRAPFVIDPANRLLRVGNCPEISGAAEVAFANVLGVPVAEVAVGRHAARAALDTGAAVSYARRRLLSDEPPMGAREDFYPGIGRFVADLHMTSLRLGDVVLETPVAVVPEALDQLLSAFSIDAIVGNDLFLSQTTRFDYRAGLLQIGRR